MAFPFGSGFPLQSFCEKQKGFSLQSLTQHNTSTMENTFNSREDFMTFFRDDEKLNLLSPDDRIEIFSQILIGSSDFKKELFEEIFSDYSISHLQINETK